MVGVSHDIPLWGYSGRTIRGSTASSINLDRSIILSPEHTYHILIKFEDDSIEERLVTNEAGEASIITVSPALSEAPVTFCSYTVNHITTVVKPFRLMSVKMDNRNEVLCGGMEYDDDIYDDSIFVVPKDNYSELSFNIPLVENLKLVDGVAKLADGTIENSIGVYFTKPTLSSTGSSVKQFGRARIYLSEDGVSWECRGDSNSESFQIIGGLETWITYKVAVVTVTKEGEESIINNSPQSSLLCVGKMIPPADVEGFVINQIRDKIIFNWTAIEDIDVAGYEIRYGSSWDTGIIIAKSISDTTLTIFNFIVGAGQKYFIKAIDTSGNYSLNATLGIITVNNIPFTNIIKTFAEEPSFTGTLENLEIYSNTLIFSTGSLLGTYTGPVRDNGYVATFKIGINVIVVVDGDSTWLSFPDKRWCDLPEVHWNGTEIAGRASFVVRTSNDNITWTDWQDWYPVDYSCRYFQIKMTLTRDSVDSNLACSAIDYYSDLPDVDDFGVSEVTNAATGKSIVFSKTFHEVPSVNIDIRSGSGVFNTFSVAPDTTGFTVNLWTLGGVAATGAFSYHGHGV